MHPLSVEQVHAGHPSVIINKNSMSYKNYQTYPRPAIREMQLFFSRLRCADRLSPGRSLENTRSDQRPSLSGDGLKVGAGPPALGPVGPVDDGRPRRGITAGPSLEIKTSGRSVRQNKLGSRTIAAPCKLLTAKDSRLFESAPEVRCARALVRCGRLSDLLIRLPEIWHLLGVARPARRSGRGGWAEVIPTTPSRSGSPSTQMEFLEYVSCVEKIWDD